VFSTFNLIYVWKYGFYGEKYIFWQILIKVCQGLSKLAVKSWEISEASQDRAVGERSGGGDQK